MDVQAYLSLREATFFILLSLSSAPKHGYAVMKDTASLSGGQVRLSTGTLYGAVKRLLESGWNRRVENGAGGDGARRKKEYELTGLGRRIFEAEAARLESLAAVTQKLGAGVHNPVS